jgi:hypothetical protein
MRANGRPLLVISLFLVALPSFAAAQRRFRVSDDAEWLDNCRNDWNGDDRGRACEVRQVPVRLTGRALEIDGRQNGSIRVQGWDGDSVRVTARLQASASSDAEADALLKSVHVTTDGRRITADGPDEAGRRHANWSASYVVWVPRRFDLSLEANNGSLGVQGVTGRIDMRTTNGSVALSEVGGDVHARTQNGSLNVELAGAAWDGSGLDAETQNGSVRLAVPERYAATLETGTVNGRISTDFPITVQGRISRHLTLPLNGGGKSVRAETTNGSVRITRL